MIQFRIRTPAHPLTGCAGVLFLLLSLVAGCRERAADRQVVLELETDTVQLPLGASLHEIQLRVTDPAEFEPASVQVRVGDVVRFETDDGHSHAVVFDAAGLTAEMHIFLERNAQLRGPPLLERGASWIVSFQQAPGGTYPFRCLTHGASGSIIVQ